MENKVKTVILFQGEHLREEYKNLLGQVSTAQVELEIANSGPSLPNVVLEQISSVQPKVFIVDLVETSQHNLSLFRQLNENFPQTPILALGPLQSPEFLIEALRLGVTEVLSKPVLVKKLSVAFQRILHRATGEQTKILPAMNFTFFNSTGGAGSTTIITNLGCCLNQVTGGKVLLLDLNVPIGDVAPYLGINESYLVQPPQDSIWEEMLIDHCIFSHSSGIYVLSLAPHQSPRTQTPIPNLKALLYYLRTQYNYVLVDLPNTLNDNVVSALDAADLIFLVSKCELPSLRNDQRILQVFSRLGYSLDKVKLLMNRTEKHDLSRIDVRRILNFEVFWNLPSDFRSVSQSIHQGRPLTQEDQISPLSKSFSALAGQIHGISNMDKSLPTV